MGLLTGLATIATFLTVVVAIAGALVIGLTAFVAVPALLESRTLRRRRQISIPAWYFHPATAV